MRDAIAAGGRAAVDKGAAPRSTTTDAKQSISA